MKRRHKRTRTKVKNPYRSKFEQTFASFFPKLHYEKKTFKYPFVLEKTYKADFIDDISNPKLVVETKGRFRTYDEAKKVQALAKFFEARGCTFIVVFQDWSTPAYPQAKKRKDGTRLSQKEWAEANQIKASSWKHHGKNCLERYEDSPPRYRDSPA